jgi:MFS family permease
MSALSTAASRPPIARGDHRVTLAALALSAIVYGLLQCFAIPALPEIERVLHASPNSASWVLTAFLISASVATPVLGRLGDMYGKERVLVIALLALCVGAAMSALAHSMSVLVAGRVLQGVSGGFFPLAFAIIRDEFPRDRVASGLGLMASLLGVGSGAGVVLAGPIVEGLGYQWLFWIPLIGAAVAAVATFALVPESPVKAGGRVDWIGGALMSLGLIALLLAVSRTTTWGWVSARTLGLAAVGLAGLVAWVAVDVRIRDPLVDMRMLRIRGVWTTNVVALLVGVGMFAAFILVPEFVQEPRSTGYGFGASITGGGIYLLPMTTMLLVVGSQAGRFERRIGPRATLIGAAVVSALAWLLLVVAHDQPWQIYLASGLVGIGNGLAFSAMPILITASVRQDETGVANGMNNVMRTIGGAIGGQIAATFLAHDLVRGMPAEHGYQLAFLMGAVALLVAVAVSLAVPTRIRPR